MKIRGMVVKKTNKNKDHKYIDHRCNPEMHSYYCVFDFQKFQVAAETRARKKAWQQRFQSQVKLWLPKSFTHRIQPYNIIRTSQVSGLWTLLRAGIFQLLHAGAGD